MDMEKERTLLGMEMVTFTKMRKMSRFWGMIENFLLGLLSWRLFMRHVRGDVSQAVVFVSALNVFCVLSQLCPHFSRLGN